MTRNPDRLLFGQGGAVVGGDGAARGVFVKVLGAGSRSTRSSGAGTRLADRRWMLAPMEAWRARVDPGRVDAHARELGESDTDEIRVAVVDEHDLIRIGLQSAIDAEPGFVCVAASSGADALTSRARADVVVLDYHLPEVDGLELCRRIKAGPSAPAVVLYSANADQALAVPALVAGADAIVYKGAPARELLAALRDVARGGRCLPPLEPALLDAARSALDASDLPILGMLVAGSARDEIVATLRLGAGEFDHRIDAMVERLRPAGE